MAEEPSKPDVQRFDTQEHNVSCLCDYICCGSAKLILGPEDAEYIKKCWGPCCTSNKRGPYGEMGTVDSEQCLCFYGFRAASLIGAEDVQCIGCGCGHEEVDKIVAELKKRQGLRGDRAKTRMGEATLSSLDLLHKKLDAIMAKIDVPPVTSEMER